MIGGEAVPKSICRGLAPWQVKLALQLFLDDQASDHSVGRVAARCGLSRSYFEKAFKASLGTPPHRWQMQRRLQRAGEMLEQTDDSISTIASRCGFSDQSHLTRMFRIAMGASPAAWRRQRRAAVAHLP